MQRIKARKVFRLISILSYCFIMLNGQMIALPFIFFIIYSMFGSEGARTAASSIAGFVGLLLLLYLLRIKKKKQILLIELAAFMLLCAPLIERLTSVPLVFFNYKLFIIPAISFVTCYFLSLMFSLKELNNQSIER